MPAQAVYAGYRTTTSDGVTLEILHPSAPPLPHSEPNDEGLVIRLTYGEASFLLTPDLGPAAETALLQSGQWLHGTVLQIPSHGSAQVSSSAFIQAVEPQVAVVQVDTGNRFGHPAPEVIARLENVSLYRSDQHGAITISTDGTALWITHTEHPPPDPES